MYRGKPEHHNGAWEIQRGNGRREEGCRVGGALFGKRVNEGVTEESAFRESGMK